jgi:hypothetical protein
MFRKTTLALAAAATLAIAAIPTAASASHWRDGWRHHQRPHYGVTVRYAAPYYAYAHRCYIKKRYVSTRWGWKVKRIRICR